MRAPERDAPGAVHDGEEGDVDGGALAAAQRRHQLAHVVQQHQAAAHACAAPHYGVV